MKSILCFGDSLTWGAIAGPRRRHAFEDRWPNVLGAGLAGQARCIEEGQNGRLTMHDDPSVVENRNGAALLPALLMSHQPLDLIIIMLGTNDLKWAYRQRAFDASLGIGRLIDIVRQQIYSADYKAPDILVVSPPHAVATPDPFFTSLYEHAIAESHHFARHYADRAREEGCHFFDAATVAVADPVDGVHLDAANTRAIGAALIPVVKGILKL